MIWKYAEIAENESGHVTPCSPLIGQDTVFVTPMEQRVRLELACVAQCVMVASPGEL